MPMLFKMNEGDTFLRENGIYSAHLLQMRMMPLAGWQTNHGQMEKLVCTVAPQLQSGKWKLQRKTIQRLRQWSHKGTVLELAELETYTNKATGIEEVRIRLCFRHGFMVSNTINSNPEFLKVPAQKT